jgi:hypothetical protein
LGDRLLRYPATRHAAIGVVVCGLMALMGCNSVPSAGLQTLVAVVSGTPVQAPKAIPGVRYLRVRSAGAASFLVLGDFDNLGAGRTQVWYSAGRQVLRLFDGRVAGSAGLGADWTSVTWVGLPASWAEVTERPVHYLRVRDTMPGHLMGLREAVTVRRTAAPASLTIPGVSESEWRRWTWFVEEATSVDARGHRIGGFAPLPTAMFAVDLSQPGDAVLYSRQCLAPDVCLEIQQWPAGSAP